MLESFLGSQFPGGVIHEVFWLTEMDVVVYWVKTPDFSKYLTLAKKGGKGKKKHCFFLDLVYFLFTLTFYKQTKDYKHEVIQSDRRLIDETILAPFNKTDTM